MSRVYKAIDLRRVEARSPEPVPRRQGPDRSVRSLLRFDPGAGARSRQAAEPDASEHRPRHRRRSRRPDGLHDDGVFIGRIPTRQAQAGEGCNSYSASSATGSSLRSRSALDFAHRTGIVHGDLKPGNVIITEAGEIKVIDFGIARFFARPKESAVDAKPGGKHWEAVSALTPPYASPEMIEDQEPDPRDDVYALACIAHEVLTGRHPFARSAATTRAMPAPRSCRTLRSTARSSKRSCAACDSSVATGRRPRRHSSTISRASVTSDGDVSWRSPRSWRSRRSAPCISAAPERKLLLQLRKCRGSPPARSFAMCDLPADARAARGHVHAGFARRRLRAARAQVAIADRPSRSRRARVTIGEFEEFADEPSCRRKVATSTTANGAGATTSTGTALDDGRTTQHPVSCVSWDDAVAYAAWLSKKTGQAYRLPSASEWEYAASAGAYRPRRRWSTTSPRRASKRTLPTRPRQRQYPGWNVLACNDRYAQSAPVGSFAPNAFGLHDMIGNVFEWVQDCWSDIYQGAPTERHRRGATATAIARAARRLVVHRTRVSCAPATAISSNTTIAAVPWAFASSREIHQ